MADAVEARQVTVRFSTQLPAALRCAATALAVPAHLSRYGLSEVVNSLLALGASARNSGKRRARARGGGDARALPRGLRRVLLSGAHALAPLARAEKHVAFDFLINDELLVTSLEAFLVQRGISTVRRGAGGPCRGRRLSPKRMPPAPSLCALAARRRAF